MIDTRIDNVILGITVLVQIDCFAVVQKSLEKKNLHFFFNHTCHVVKQNCTNEYINNAVSSWKNPTGVEALLVSLAELGGTLTVNAAGTAVERVMDEEVTVQAELTVTCWTGEYLQTQRKRKKKSCLTVKQIKLVHKFPP